MSYVNIEKRRKYVKLLIGIALLVPAWSFKDPIPEPEPDPEIVAKLYPKDYFQRPVDDALRLSGTFGELRPDHFHSGIDIKSKTGGTGQPVLAAAGGYVDKIKVQAGGYGNVLYIKHPNGYTTVYAHLDRFSPDIDAFVKEYQYRKESFEVDLDPPATRFPVKKGEEIGKLGNTGSSQGPHLHFEIRNSATGRAINPQLFGLPVTDNQPPDLRDMKVYILGENREVQGSKPFPIVRRKDGSYAIEGDTVKIGAWRAGFGIKTYDRMTGLRNDNGVYAIVMSVDDKPAFQWRMDELDFDETRYLNAHVDYAAYKRFDAWFHRCFVLPGDRLSNYVRTETMGSVALYKDKPVKVNIKVVDASGNSSRIEFWALRDEANMETPVSAPYQFDLYSLSENRIDLEGFSLEFPKGALYEDLRFEYATSPETSTGFYSPVHHLHNNKTPIHKYFEISIAPQTLPEELRSKAVIARCSGGRPDNCGGVWHGERLTTKIRSLGDYCVMADSDPPTIVPLVFDDDMRRKKTIAFRIRDNFDATDSANGLRYRATIDGQWVLFVYDRKNARITHTFDGTIEPGPHHLKLVVKDDRGNEATFEGKFIR